MDEPRESRHDIAVKQLAVHAHNVTNSLEDFLSHRENWDERNMKRMVRLFMPRDLVGEYIKLINTWLRDGFAPNSGVENKFDTNLEVGKGKIKTNAKLVQDHFEVLLSDGYAKWVGALPGNLQAYAMSPTIRAKDIDLRFHSDGTSIFNHNFENSLTRIVLGKKGAGKSSFAANYIMPDDISAGMLAVGNMKLANIKELGENDVGLPYYIYADTLADTLLAVCENGIEGFRTSRVYDEPQTSHARTSATSRKYLTQKNIFLTNRKLGMCDLIMLQRRQDVPSEMRDLVDVTVYKPDAVKKWFVDVTLDGRTEYYTGAKDTPRRCKELEDRGLPVFDYISDWLSVFEVDFEYDDYYVFLRKELGRLDGRELITRRQFQAIKEFIESMDKTEELTNEVRARVYLEMRDINKLSWKDLADSTGWTVSRLRHWERKLDAST